MKTQTILCFWLLLFAIGAARAQPGFSLEGDQRQVEIPFEYSNNFIILTLTINNTLPLKFIYDTGAEHTILSKRQISDLLRVHYERVFHITGSDMKTQLTAYLVRQIRFDITDKVSAPKEDILVLEEDYFRFEEYAGINVQGILAGNIFSKYIIKINYQRQVITLYDRATFKMREDGFEELPVEIFRNKLYLNVNMQVLQDTVVPVKLLLDTGAGLPLLLFSNIHPLVHPPANAIPSNIGMGLGGYLEGFTGRVFGLTLGTRAQHSIISYYQSLDTTQNLDYLNHRNGLIGNGILNRFILMIDYQNAKIWLKPSRTFKDEFVFDRSGLSFIASGLYLNVFTVQNVLPNSPAWNVDIRKGDEIMSVGITPSGFYSLGDLQKILQKKPGKKIKLVIKRDGKRLKKTIVLRDIL